jgi:hypothetical protein
MAFALLGPLLLALAAQGRGPVQMTHPQGAIDEAIERGIDRLLAAQNRDGSWGTELREQAAHFDKRNGETALALYTLRKCRIPVEHHALQRGLAFLEAGFPTKNYSVSMQLLALESIGDAPRFGKRMQMLLEALLEARIANLGVWGYPEHASVYVNLSNTQYAALALRAAAHAGLKVPRAVWQDLVEGALRFQQDPAMVDFAAAAGRTTSGKLEVAGFGYVPNERGSPSASMTAAGVAILAIAREGLGKSLDPPTTRKLERAQKLGLAWLEKNFSVEQNPGGNAAWHYYYLYGLERVGSLLGLETIGIHEWYRTGAQKLVREQREDGAWATAGEVNWPPEPLSVANTCFALLFLNKATAAATSGAESSNLRTFAAESPSDAVWIRAAMRPKLALWVSGFSPGALKAYSRAAPSEKPVLHVAKVEFVVDNQIVQTLEVDASKPWAGEKLAAQLDIAAEGKHVLRARVHVALSPDVATPEKPFEILSSGAIEITVRDVFRPWMLDYARDAAASKLALTKLEASSSSQFAEWSQARHAFDGFQGSGWLFAAADKEPWIAVELEKAQRVRSLVLSHANANPAELDEYARATRVALYVNRESAPIEFDLDADPMKKTEIALPAPVVLRNFKLVVLAFTGGTSNKSISGFAEIEAR